MKRFLFSCLALLFAAYPVETAMAQAVLEDAKGKTSLLLAEGSVLGVNSADGSIQAGLFHLTNTQAFVYGGLIRAKSTDGVSSLFSKASVSPDVSVEGTLATKAYGGSLVGVKVRRDWTPATLIDSTALPIPTISKPTLASWEAGLHYQIVPAKPLFSALAAAIGRRQSTNYDDLPKATLRSQRIATDTAKHLMTVLEQTTDGRSGTVEDETVTFFDADFLIMPFGDSPTSMRVFARLLPERPDASAQRNSGGIDIGVHKPSGDPVLDRYAAIVVEVAEARPGDKHTDVRHRVTLSLVANLAPLLGRLVDWLQ